MDEYQLIPAKLAEAIKLSQSAVRQVAIGKTRVSVPVALRFAKYFGLTPEYWLDLQNEYDLSEAARDSELTTILKGISKAKKPLLKKYPNQYPWKKKPPQKRHHLKENQLPPKPPPKYLIKCSSAVQQV
jgi:addiction module HigA family antidote